jgi:hypothetical protein
MSRIIYVLNSTYLIKEHRETILHRKIGEIRVSSSLIQDIPIINDVLVTVGLLQKNNHINVALHQKVV